MLFYKMVLQKLAPDKKLNRNNQWNNSETAVANATSTRKQKNASSLSEFSSLALCIKFQILDYQGKRLENILCMLLCAKK